MWFLYVLLCTLSWALINVLDSSIVHNHERHPMVVMWSQSLFSLPILALLPFFLPLHTTWLPMLLLFGVVGYIGDLWFFHVLAHVDVSISNIAWCILSLLLTACGFFLFGETWGVSQSIGAVLVVGGVLILSVYHQKIDFARMIGLVTVLALLFLPYYVVKKMAIFAGENPLAVFYWMVLGREVFSFSFPWLFPKVRHTALTAMRQSSHFMMINGVVILLYFFAEYTGALAYAFGPLSLVAIVSNVQPFLVMGIAGILVWFWPSKAPRELLTRQSVQLKILCFLVVFFGLALLGTGL